MNLLKNYHIQVTGPSGSGKSYFAKKLKLLGYNAVDADSIEGLGKFINKDGKEVKYNHEGGLEWLTDNIWVWDFSVLKRYLSKNPRVLIFGGATNEAVTSKVFDYVFYLKLSKKEILTNLKSENRTNPYGKTEAQQEYASHKIDEFYDNIPSDWIPLVSRKPKELIDEIEKHIKAKLVNQKSNENEVV